MNILTLEDEKFKSVNIKGNVFKIRFISPRDVIAIAQRRMKLQNGNPVESLTQSDFLFFENIAIIDTCIEEYPKGFKENESALGWDDEELINMVADEIRTHTNDVKAKLKKNKPDSGVA